MNRRPGLALAGIVAAASVGVAAWHGATAETWADMMLLTTCGVLMLSAIAAVCRGSDRRRRIAGFAVFGWGYFAMARWYTYNQGPVLTVHWVPGSGDIHNDFFSLPPAVRIAHDAWALAFAVCGNIVADLLFKHRSARATESADQTLESGGPSGWWRDPAFAGLLGFGLVAVLAVLADWRWEPDIWAGAAFLLTWALLGMAILGAVCAEGRGRLAWCGAASFGIGYLVLAFSSLFVTDLPTNHLVNAVFRPGGPPTAAVWPDDDLATDDESRRVGRALEQPIALHFPEETPLKIVLEQFKNAIRPALSKDLVLHVRSASLAYDRKILDESVVTIDRASIPAKDALSHCLGQCGLTYRVQSGYVRIIPDAYQPLAFEDDPVMIAGHSLVAIFAAVFGGAGAVLVAGFVGRHRANDDRGTV